ncbi:hypothetical protein JCM2811A_29450 [Methylorubrum rhodinum]
MASANERRTLSARAFIGTSKCLIPSCTDQDRWSCSLRPADDRRRAVARAIGDESWSSPIGISRIHKISKFGLNPFFGCSGNGGHLFAKRLPHGRGRQRQDGEEEGGTHPRNLNGSAP